MTPLWFVFLWFIFLASVALSLQRLTRCFTRFSIFTIVFGCFFVRNGITVPFDYDVNPVFAGIEISQLALQRFYLSLFLMYSCLVAGILIGRYFFGSGIPNAIRFRAEMSRPLEPGVNKPVLLGFVIAACLLIIVFQINTDLSSWDLLSGSVTAEQYRENRTVSGLATHYSLGPMFRIASIVRLGLLPLLVATLFFIRKKSGIWAILFWAVTVVGVVAGLLSGQKTPAIIVLVTILLAVYLRRGNLIFKQFVFRGLVFVSLLIFIVLPYLYSVQYPEKDYGERLKITFFRLTSEYDRSLQLYFEIYPEVRPHTRGLSATLIRSIAGLSNEEKEPERFIPTYYLGDDYPNTWNAAFIGQAWVDWGYWGVGGVSLGIGILLQGFAAWFRRAKKTALALGTQVALMIASTRLSEVGYTACLLSYGLLSCFLVSILLKENKRASC